MDKKPRLIDADALKTVFDEWFVNKTDHRTMGEIIDDAPTIEAEHVRHGRWVRCYEDWRKQFEGDECSACGFQHYGTAINHYHYCPNCGAKMDAGKEKEDDNHA